MNKKLVLLFLACLLSFISWAIAKKLTDDCSRTIESGDGGSQATALPAAGQSLDRLPEQSVSVSPVAQSSWLSLPKFDLCLAQELINSRLFLAVFYLLLPLILVEVATTIHFPNQSTDVIWGAFVDNPMYGLVGYCGLALLVYLLFQTLSFMF